MKTAEDMVREFHEKFRIPMADRPRFDRETVWRRWDHLQEEMGELHTAGNRADVVGVADAVVDLVYVAIGLALELGIPFNEVFAEVHRSNMEKERVDDGTGHKLGIRKPAGWRAPDVRGILNAHGMEER